MGSNARSLAEGFQRNGHEVTSIDPVLTASSFRKQLARIENKFLTDTHLIRISTQLDEQIASEIKKNSFDVMFVFRGLTVSKTSLERFPGIKIHYHPDDSTNSYNRSNLFDESEILYDFHFTSKRHNVNEIRDRTKNKNVHFIWYAYDDRLHRSIEDLSARNSIGFIGTRRPDRDNLIRKLAFTYGRNMHIVGHEWNRDIPLRLRANVRPPAYGNAYLECIKRAPIQLGLLNSDNRDSHTARSFELPASGALILAQSSIDHMELFNNMEDAIIFNDETELINQIDWLFKNPSDFHRIRLNGTTKLLDGKNTWMSRAAEITQIVFAQ